MSKERVEFLDFIIKEVKEKARIGDRPVAYAKNDKGEISLSILDVEEKYQAKLCLYTLKEIQKAKEIVLVNEAFVVRRKVPTKLIGEVKDQEDKEDCFVICYFSEDKCLSHTLLYKIGESGTNKPIWVEESSYLNGSDFVSSFNPFKFTKEDVKGFMVLIEQDNLRENGVLERINMKFGFHIDVYRLKGKVFFESFNHRGEVFGMIPVQDEDASFEKALKELKKILSSIGGLG